MPKAKVTEEVKETKKAPAKKAAAKKAEPKVAEKVEKAEVKKAPAKKAAAKKAEVKVEEVKVETPVVEEKKPAKKAPAKKAAPKKAEEVKVEEKKPAKKAPAKKAAPKKAAKKEVVEEVKPVVEEPVVEETVVEEVNTPRGRVAFIGSECYPFVKSGGLGDVMFALPKALVKENCDVRVVIPNYACIKKQYKEQMEYVTSYYMDLCSDGRQFYVGIMKLEMDGVTYYFVDNEEFFSEGNPYTDMVKDIAKFCYFSKAALTVLNAVGFEPEIIHCHDWQAALVPIYLREKFGSTPLAKAKSVLTIHNLRFQGIYGEDHLKYWTGLPHYVFNNDCLQENGKDANMLKGGLAYADMISTVSETYAQEILTDFFGEHLDGHLRYHAGKLRGIVNGIDTVQWDPATDPRLTDHYDLGNVLTEKRKNKKSLQEEVGLEVDDSKFVIGLISRLTDQKGLDLINAIMPEVVDDNTQVVILGTGDPVYEDSFRYYESVNPGKVSSSIMYDETRAHHIYAGADALLVPSLFEPCGLTQLNAMRYGTVPIVRETGGLKDTVEPYNEYENTGNGFTFDHYDAQLLLNAINYAKSVYFGNRWVWDEMVQRDMAKDVSWEQSARRYIEMYESLFM